MNPLQDFLKTHCSTSFIFFLELLDEYTTDTIVDWLIEDGWYIETMDNSYITLFHPELERTIELPYKDDPLYEDILYDVYEILCK